jgi:hypothetical protein
MRFRDAQSVSLVSIHHLDYSTYLALVYLTSHSELQSALLSWLPYVCNSHDSDDCLDLETCSLLVVARPVVGLPHVSLRNGSD